MAHIRIHICTFVYIHRCYEHFLGTHVGCCLSEIFEFDCCSSIPASTWYRHIYYIWFGRVGGSNVYLGPYVHIGCCLCSMLTQIYVSMYTYLIIINIYDTVSIIGIYVYIYIYIPMISKKLSPGWDENAAPGVYPGFALPIAAASSSASQRALCPRPKRRPVVRPRGSVGNI